MDQSFVRRVHTLQGLKNGSFDSFTGRVRQALPQVGVILSVDQVRRVRRLRAHVSAQDDCGEAFCLNRDGSLVRVENGTEETGVLLGLRALGCIELVFGSLTRHVVVGEDLLQDASDLSEVISCK